ncbi:hypothetical protein KAR91_63570 [Candidatus Pacearchaeota archaeon]|nr:hypothetical protein [Candidatus Pacearchaeota archaeon]
MPAYGTFKYAEGKYGSGWQLPFSEVVGSYRGHRFTMLMTEDGQTQMHDKLVEANTTIYMRYLERGLITRFDPATDHIFIFSPLIDDLQSSDNSNIFLANKNSAEDFFQLRGDDYYDGKNIRWSMGMIPFDTSLLYKLGSAANWTNENGSEEVWSDLGNTVYSTGTWVYVTISSIPAGSYRVFYLLAGSTGSETGAIECTGAVLNGSQDVIASVPTGGAWYYYDMIAAANDSITFRFRRIAAGVNVNCGELVLWPISNSKNFPLDVRDQSLMLTKITEVGG